MITATAGGAEPAAAPEQAGAPEGWEAEGSAHCGLLPPGSGAVGLWWASLHQPPVALPEARRDVDSAPLARADRMAHPGDGQAVVVADALLRRVLGPQLGLPPHRIRLRRRCARCGGTDHGRPFALNGAGRPGPDFSLAHCDGLAVVALAPAGTRVGVEVGRHRPGGEDREMHGRTSLPERAAVPARGEPGMALLRARTGKEAVAKAAGLGPEEAAAVDVLGAHPLGGGWWQERGHDALLVFPRLTVAEAVPGPAAFQVAIALLGTRADKPGARR